MAANDEPEDVGSSWLDERPLGPTEDTLGVAGGAVQQVVETPYAVELDLWGQRRGADLAKEDAMKALGAKAEDCADLFGMCFELEPELTEHCTNETKARYVAALKENPEYQGLHTNTNLDVVRSEIASVHFTKEYIQLAEEQKKREKQRGGREPTPQEQLKDDMQAAAAANKASQSAQDEVDEFDNMQEGLGCGSGDGSFSGMKPSEVKRLFDKVKKDQNLRQIMELAGKYRLMARAKQANKVVHGQDDTIGIVLDNDLARLLPSELAALVHPLLKLDAMRRYVERAMMCRQYRGIKKVAKGPIIVAIDESGSMQGDKIYNAKAMALAMAWVARHQNRWCGFVSWSDNPAQIRTLALPPNKWPTEEVMKWLANFIGGGTRIPAAQMPNVYKQLGAQVGRTDIIWITDGDVPGLSDKELRDFNHWRKEVQAKSICISIQMPAAAFKPIVDDYYEIKNLNVNDAAVGQALSV